MQVTCVNDSQASPTLLVSEWNFLEDTEIISGQLVTGRKD